MTESDGTPMMANLGPWPTFDTADGLCRLPENKHVEFFGATSARARALCLRCPLQMACAEYAIPIAALHGVWGGTTMESRRRSRLERDLAGPTLTVTPRHDGWYAAFAGLGRKVADGENPITSSGTTKLGALRNLAKKVTDRPDLLEMIADKLAEGQELETDGYDWGVKRRYENKKYGAALWAPRVPSEFEHSQRAVIHAKSGSLLA